MYSPLPFELNQMCGHALGRRTFQLLDKTVVNDSDDLRNRARTIIESRQDLRVPVGTMANVLVDERRGIIHDRSMTGQQPPRTQIPNALQGAEVFRQVAAASRRDHDCAANSQQVATEDVRAEPKTTMVQRVTRGVNRHDGSIAGCDAFVGRDRILPDAKLPDADPGQRAAIIGTPDM